MDWFLEWFTGRNDRYLMEKPSTSTHDSTVNAWCPGITETSRKTWEEDQCWAYDISQCMGNGSCCPAMSFIGIQRKYVQYSTGLAKQPYTTPIKIWKVPAFFLKVILCKPRGEVIFFVVEVFANLKLSRSYRNRNSTWKTNRDHVQHFMLTVAS